MLFTVHYISSMHVKNLVCVKVVCILLSVVYSYALLSFIRSGSCDKRASFGGGGIIIFHRILPTGHSPSNFACITYNQTLQEINISLIDMVGAFEWCHLDKHRVKYKYGISKLQIFCKWQD